MATRLVSGESLAGLGLGEIDGRVDVRGLWLVSTKELPGISSKDPLATTPVASAVEWRNLDLSHSTMRIDLVDSVVDNVRFDRVGIRDWRLTSCEVVDCGFTGADIREIAFDGYNSGMQDRQMRNRPSIYVRCDFSRARIGPYGTLGRATFEECLFADTKFTSPMWFRGAQFRRSVFTGTYRQLCFGWTGPFTEVAPWLDVDLGKAEIASLEVYAHTGPGTT